MTRILTLFAIVVLLNIAPVTLKAETVWDNSGFGQPFSNIAPPGFSDQRSADVFSKIEPASGNEEKNGAEHNDYNTVFSIENWEGPPMPTLQGKDSAVMPEIKTEIP